MGVLPNIDELLKEIVTEISGSPAPSIQDKPGDVLDQMLRNMRGPADKKTQSVEPANNTGIQSPIKGKYYCSGIFGAGDARHGGVHNGVDLRISGGSPVYPMTDGIVTNVGSGGKGGNSVSIRHANGLKTYYAHLATVSVGAGNPVDKNTVIGTVGDSGNAKGTAPHVHFEVHENGHPVNPNKFIFVPPYSNIQPGEVAWLSKDNAQPKMAFYTKIDKIEKALDSYCDIIKSL